jgi:hypothetical protein
LFSIWSVFERALETFVAAARYLALVGLGKNFYVPRVASVPVTVGWLGETLLETRG